MTAADLDHVLAFLIPIFLAAANGDHAAARAAALKLVECHGAANGEELLLAAEIIALSFATLDSLGKSVGDPTITISTRLRLRSNASALSRAANRNRDALAQGRKRAPQPAVVPPAGTAVAPPQLTAVAPPQPTIVAPPAAELPEAVQKVRDAIVQAAPSLAQTLTQGGQPMSRQQRRFLTRKAEQARASQEREARQAARRAERAAALAKDKAAAAPEPRYSEAQRPETHRKDDLQPAASALPGARDR